jgi:four helix bundle protein
MNHPDDLILPHGGYQKLRSFAVALAAYDGTLIFCNRFIGKRSRTHDQMVQAARSGVQNIAEGSLASGTSKKTEMKLTSVARASLGELIRDYEDYLRQNRLPIWQKDSPRSQAVRARLAGRLKKPGLPDLPVSPERSEFSTSHCLLRCTLWKPRSLKSAPTSCCASLTRPVTCWSDSYRDWRAISSRMAVLRKGFIRTGKIIAEQVK